MIIVRDVRDLMPTIATNAYRTLFGPMYLNHAYVWQDGPRLDQRQMNVATMTELSVAMYVMDTVPTHTPAAMIAWSLNRSMFTTK